MAAAQRMQRLGHAAGGAGAPLHPWAACRPGCLTAPGARATRLQRLRAANAGALSAGDDQPLEQQQQPERPEAPYDLKPFPRRRERNPYRLLGVDREASFEEIQDARNYLFERYKWDEPSREAIEGAFDVLLQAHYKERQRTGFAPPGFRGRGAPAPPGAPSLVDRVKGLFDPTVTTRTIINEGAVFGALALWVLFSADPSFPLAGSVIYCVYQFQQKRVKRDPEGPFLFGNPMAGAVLSTLCCLGIACGVMALLTNPLTAVIGQSARQVGAFITIATMGALGMYLK